MFFRSESIIQSSPQANLVERPGLGRGEARVARAAPVEVRLLPLGPERVERGLRRPERADAAVDAPRRVRRERRGHRRWRKGR